jgi:hypothetical protein
MTKPHSIHELWQPHTKLDCDAVLTELEAILASSHFCNSKRYPAFLRYIVENALSGKTEQLKERTLGIEVFDRPPTFDTNSDTVVRYTAGEVRKRLQLYYAERGHAAALRIALPTGSYIPEFTLHTGEGTEARTEAAATQDEEASTHEQAVTEAHASGQTLANTRIAAMLQILRQLWVRHKSGFAVAATVLLAAAGFGIWRMVVPSPQSIVDRFWAPVLHDQKSVLLCTGSVVFANNNYSGVITANKDIDYSFVSLQNASAIAQISSALARQGMSFQMAAAPSTTLHDLSGHSVVLLGFYWADTTIRGPCGWLRLCASTSRLRR